MFHRLCGLWKTIGPASVCHYAAEVKRPHKNGAVLLAAIGFVNGRAGLAQIAQFNSGIQTGTILNSAITEASGGIRPDTAPAIAATGVDLLSVGWLTHSVTVLDIGLDHRS